MAPRLKPKQKKRNVLVFTDAKKQPTALMEVHRRRQSPFLACAIFRIARQGISQITDDENVILHPVRKKSRRFMLTGSLGAIQIVKTPPRTIQHQHDTTSVFALSHTIPKPDCDSTLPHRRNILIYGETINLLHQQIGNVCKWLIPVTTRLKQC